MTQEIRSYPKNAKKHPDAQLKLIARSLKTYGWRQPIVVDTTNTIIVGHGRWMAYQKYPDGIAEPWIVQANDLTPEQVRGYRLMDNKTNESDWDMALAIEELKELDSLGFDIELTGFDKDLLIEPDEKDDVIPDNAPPVAKLGDLWALGRHRVMCGDSTDKASVERLMDGKKADMVFTDPPYGMRLDTDYTKMAETKVKSKSYRPVIGDDADFDPRPIMALFDDVKEQFWWGADWYYSRLPDGGSWIVWDKRSEASDGLTGNHFEMLWSRQHHRRDIIRHLWSGFTARNQDTKRVHPTEKPVAVLERVVTDYSGDNSRIADLFLGSGSTLIAAEKTGRICYGMEIDPKYCDVIIKRWEDYTGKKAEKVQ